MLTRFSCDLAWWPSFSGSKWPSFELGLKIIKTNILSNIHDDWLKNVTWSLKFVFPLIWPGDLVSDSKWPNFELDLEIIKTNILSTIHDDYFKNVASGVLTRFSVELAWWPSFGPQVTQFQTWPRNHQDKHFEQASWLLQKLTSIVLTIFSFELTWWPVVFDPKWHSFKSD